MQHERIIGNAYVTRAWSDRTLRHFTRLGGESQSGGGERGQRQGCKWRWITIQPRFPG